MEITMKKKTLKEPRRKRGIVKQISIAFIIPILFVILIGALSYMQSEKGLREKYEESAMTSPVHRPWTAACGGGDPEICLRQQSE